MMDRHSAVTAAYEIPGQTWPSELCWLYDTFSQSKQHAEIGTYCGRSLFASCAGMLPESHVVVVDDGSDWNDRKWVSAVQQATIAKLPEHIQVTNMKMDSVEAARECHRLGMQFDSVFIDGNHHYAECKADIENWRTMVRPGGIIAGHDYWPVHVGVMDAVNEVFGGMFEVVPKTRIWVAKCGT